MNWYEIVDKVKPYVFKIETPEGHGTGFLCLYNFNKTFCGIATAAHVVQHAHRWRQPIQLTHALSEETLFLKPEDYFVFIDGVNDSAVLMFQPGSLKLPKDILPLAAADRRLKIGVEVGWLGYPAVASHALCFFSGNISARVDKAYFIDGVAINGVSGGPVFTNTSGKTASRIIGTISAYYPNLSTGNSLPGLSFAQGVNHFHDTIGTIKSVDEAREKESQSNVVTISEPQKESPPAVQPRATKPPPVRRKK